MTNQPKDNELVAQLAAMKQELQAIASKLSELEMEKEEHQLVVETLEPMEKQRKCFRLVGGVLVESSVENVLPFIQQNAQGIQMIMRQLAETYKKKEDDMNQFQKTHQIRIKN